MLILPCLVLICFMSNHCRKKQTCITQYISWRHDQFTWSAPSIWRSHSCAWWLLRCSLLTAPMTCPRCSAWSQIHIHSPSTVFNKLTHQRLISSSLSSSTKVLLEVLGLSCHTTDLTFRSPGFTWFTAKSSTKRYTRKRLKWINMETNAAPITPKWSR